MYYKEDWPLAQKRLDALWHGEIIDRCCVSVTSPRRGCERFFSGISPHGLYNSGAMLCARHMDDPEAVLKKQEEIFSNTFYGGEAFPQVWLNFGPAGQAAYFGAPYQVSENTVWFSPVVNDWDADTLRYHPDCQVLAYQRNMVEYLAHKGQGRFLVSSPDNAGCLDALASLRDTQELLVDMVTDPAAVLQANRAVMQAWDDSGKQLFEAAKDCNYGGASIGWLSIWAGGRMSQLQSDISVMLSAEMFEQFVMPELQFCARSQDYSLYHMDGQSQIRHLDQILSIPEIGVIQWVSVAGEPSYLSFIPVFQRIQKSGKGLLINDVNPQDIPFLLEHLSAKGLLLMTSAENQQDAEDIIQLVEKSGRGHIYTS